MSNFTRTRPLDRDDVTIEAAADAAADIKSDERFRSIVWVVCICVASAVAALWVKLS